MSLDTTLNANTQFTLPTQLMNLGPLVLDLDPVSGTIFPQGNVLDVGCGVKATLVKYLRESGVDIDGIDPLIEETADHLMKQGIMEINSPPYLIPRPDNQYDLVITHMCTPLYLPFSEMWDKLIDARLRWGFFGSDTEAEIYSAMHAMCAFTMLSEVLRVLKPDGKVVCMPSLNLLDPAAQNLVHRAGYGVKREEIEVGTGAVITATFGNGERTEVIEEKFTSRAILSPYE